MADELEAQATNSIKDQLLAEAASSAKDALAFKQSITGGHRNKDSLVHDAKIAAEIGLERLSNTPAVLQKAALIAGNTTTRSDFGARPDKLVPDAPKDLATPELDAKILGSIAKTEELRKNYSIATENEQKEIQKSQELRDADYEAKGDTSLGAQALKEVGDFGSSIVDYLSNPRALFATSVESAPDLILSAVGGGFVANAAKRKVQNELVAELAGSLLTKKAKKKLSKVLAEEGVETALINKAGTKAATKFGVALTGLTEGGSSAAEVMDTITNMDFASLEKESALFREYRAKDYTPAEAKAAVMADAFLMTFAAVASSAAAIGKVTGADEAVSNVLVKGRTKKAVKDSIEGGVKEAVEEGAQSGTGQALQNVVASETFKDDQDVLEGVGEATGSGAIAGFTTGGTLAGTRASIDTLTAEAGKLGSKLTTAASKKAAASLKDKTGLEVDDLKEVGANIKATKDDITKGDVDVAEKVPYKAKTKVEALSGVGNAVAIIESDAPQSTKEAAVIAGLELVESEKAKLLARYTDLKATIETSEDKEAAIEETRSLAKEIAALNQDADTLSAYGESVALSQERAAEVYKQIADTDIEALLSDPENFIATEGGAKTKEELDGLVNTAVKQAALAPENVSEETSTELLNNPNVNLSQAQKAVLQAHVAFAKAVKDFDGVSEEVLHGTDEGYVGLYSYHKAILNALSNNDVKGAKEAQAQLQKFMQQRIDKSNAFKEVAKNNKGKTDVPGYFTQDGKPAYVTPNSALLATLERESSLAQRLNGAAVDSIKTLESKPVEKETINQPEVEEAKAEPKVSAKGLRGQLRSKRKKPSKVKKSIVLEELKKEVASLQEKEDAFLSGELGKTSIDDLQTHPDYAEYAVNADLLIEKEAELEKLTREVNAQDRTVEEVKAALDAENWEEEAGLLDGYACKAVQKKVSKLLDDIGVVHEKVHIGAKQNTHDGSTHRGDHSIVIAYIQGKAFIVDIPQIEYMTYDYTEGSVAINEGTDLSQLSPSIIPLSEFTELYGEGRLPIEEDSIGFTKENVEQFIPYYEKEVREAEGKRNKIAKKKKQMALDKLDAINRAVAAGPVTDEGVASTESKTAENILDTVTEKLDVAKSNNKTDTQADIDFRNTNQIKANYVVRNKEEAVSSANSTQKLLDDPTHILPEDASQAEIEFMQGYPAFREAFVKFFNKNMPAEKETEKQYRFNAPINYFRQDDGTLPPEVVDALALAAYRWIGTRSKETRVNTKQDLRRIFGVSSDDLVTEEMYALSEVGARQNTIIHMLGKQALENLNIKPTKNVNVDVSEKVQVALGTNILSTLKGLGVVTTNDVPVVLMNNIVDRDTPQDKADATISFTRVTENNYPETTLGDVIGSYIKSNLIQDTAEIGTKTRKVSRTVRNSNGQQAHSEEYKRAVAYSEKPWTLNTGMVDIVRSIGTGYLQHIMGFETDTESRQINLRKSINGKNLTINNDINNMRDFVIRMGDDLTQPFYFNHEIGSNRRLYMLGSDINPQRSKLHRFMVNQEKSEQVLDLNDPEMVEMFKLAVGQSMGVKTDKMNIDDSLADFEKVRNNAIVKAGVSAMQAVLNKEEIDDTQRRAIVAAAQYGGEQIFSLRGVMNLAKFEQALANNETQVTVDAVYEVDGVTNGPFINFVQTGLVSLDEKEINRLAQGGLFLNGETSYGEWKKQGNKDMYESTLPAVKTALAKEKAETKKNLDSATGSAKRNLTAIHSMAGIVESYISMMGRNLTKNPITITNYGSGEKGIADKAAGDFVKHAYETIEAVAKGVATQEQVDYVEALRQHGLDIPKTKAGMLNYSIPYEQLGYFKYTLSQTLGKAINKAIEEEFGQQKDMSAIFLDAGRIMFAMLKPRYDAAVARKIKQLRESGELSRHAQLTKAHYDEINKSLIKAMPILNTLFTAGSNNVRDLKYGINTGATNVVEEYSKGKLSGIVKGKKGRGKLNEAGYYENTGSTNTANIYLPGVGGSERKIGPFATIGNGDAAVMNLSGDTSLDFFNVFDAGFSNISEIRQLSELLNNNMIDALTNYDLVSEVARTFRRNFEDFKADPYSIDFDGLESILLEKGFSTTSDKAEMIKSIEAHVVQLEELGKRSAALKEQVLTSPGAYITQFNMEKGGAPLNSTKIDALKILDEAMTEIEEGQDVDLVLQETENRFSPSPVVKDTLPVDNIIKEHFESKPVQTKDDILELLANDALYENIPYGSWYKQIALLLAKSLPKNIDIVLASDTATRNKYSMKGDYRAVNFTYFGKGNRPTMVFSAAGTSSAYHGMSLETLLHELLHASLSPSVAAYEAGYPQNKTAENALKRIEALMEEVKAKHGTEGHHVSNIHEFISWGLTNPMVIESLLELDAPKGLKARVVGFFKQVIKVIKFGRNQVGDTVFDSLVYNSGVLANNRMVALPDELIQPQMSQAQRAQDQVKKFTDHDVFDYLAQNNKTTVSTEHNEHLRNTLTNMVSKISEPLSKYYEAKDEAEAIQRAIEALDPDGINVPDSLESYGFQMSEQEKYVYQMLSTTIDSGLNDFNYSKTELLKLYHHAKKNMSYKDFMQTTNTDENSIEYKDAKASAQQRYDAIFNKNKHSQISRKDNHFINASRVEYKGNFLRNFLVLAQTNEQFRTSLDNLAPPKVQRSIWKGSIVATLAGMIQELVGLVSGYIKRDSHSANVRKRIDHLAYHIAGVNKRKRGAVEQGIYSAAGVVSATARLPINAIKTGLGKAFSSKAFKNSKINTVKAVGHIGGAILDTPRGQVFKKGVEIAHDQINKGKQGFLQAYINEMKGTTSSNWKLHAVKTFASKVIDQEREAIKTSVIQATYELFSERPTEAQKKSITKAMLKTDLVSLIEEGYSIDEVQALLLDDDKVRSELVKLEQELHQLAPVKTDVNFYIRSAKGLGIYMATGRVLEAYQLFNTNLIANVQVPGKTPVDGSKVKPIIEKMATLHAMLNTNQDEKATFGNLMASEQEATHFLFTQHSIAKADALKRSFNGAENLVIKGYTKETVNLNKDIRIVSETAGKLLEEEGYVKIAPLGKEEGVDPNEEALFIYVHENGGQNPWVQGTMANMTLGRKGTDLGNINTASDGRFAKALETNNITAAKQSAINEMFMSPTTREGSTSNMAPVVDAQGNVVSYRYMMGENLKDELLEKDNDGISTLGAMHAATQEKVNSVEVNNQLMAVLAEAYKADVAKGRVSNYVEISAQARNKEERDLWKMMPESAKEAARREFGSEKIFVRNDLYMNAFGYREFSLSDATKKDVDTPKAIEWLVNETLTKVFGVKASAKIRVAERTVAEITKEIKDIIVIRSGAVLLGNMISNTVQLVMMHGVPAKDAVQNQYKAFIAAQEYKKNDEQIRKYRLLVENATGAKVREYQNIIVELEESQANNPTRQLISEGMLQTIVEDADISKEKYTYKEGLVTRFNDQIEKLNPTVRGVVKEVLITKDTDGYKLAQQLTQISDFASRYALYTHQVEVEKKAPREAIINISNAFINYDLLTHKGLHYLNKYGVSWFFKYWTRIQRVLLDVAKENPERLVLLGLGQYATGIDWEDPSDASFLHSNPLSRFGFFDKMLMGLGSHPLAQVL